MTGVCDGIALFTNSLHPSMLNLPNVMSNNELVSNNHLSICVKIMDFSSELNLPQKTRLQRLCGFHCDFLEFPSVKFSKLKVNNQFTKSDLTRLLRRKK